MKNIIIYCFLLFILFSCKMESGNRNIPENKNQKNYYFEGMYVPFKLTTDLSLLSDNEKAMIPILIKAADLMNRIFWDEAYGKKDSLLKKLNDDELIRFVKINYGPWDRLNNNMPFIEGVGDKPEGANFYPDNMTREEFEASNLPDKKSLYTIIRRDEYGNLKSIPYHEYYTSEIMEASALLDSAARLAEQPGLIKYLTLRAQALLTDTYRESDLAWLDMTDNNIDVVIGPIESYEDKLFGYKTSHEAYILIKDNGWSRRLDKYAAFLPELQKNLPVPDKYKSEKPGTDAQLNAYDVIYYAGDCNAGSKTIAINLPNDEEVQLKKGTRRLQLKNAMRAKFDKILVPIANELIQTDQLKHITFDAFFANTMFHEVAHGLGIKNTVNGKGTVRQALKEHAAALEEGKADILGLYMINELHKKGEIEGDIKDYYVTFMTSIFRSVRFGSETAHGTANMIRFNFFKEMNAFVRDPESGKYNINLENMQNAVEALSKKILIFQGNGDYEGVDQFVKNYAVIGDQLAADLEKLKEKNIPVDIVFEQGTDILGL